MSDITLNAGSGGANLGTDQVAGTPNIDYQVVKIGYSVSGSTPTQVSTSAPLPVVQTGALPAGSNTIGAVTQASGPWTSNTTQLGGAAINLGTGNTGTGTLRVVLATDQPTMANAQPVAQSGSWTITVNGVVADATTFTRGTTLQLPVGGIVEAVQSALTTGQARALSLTTAALLRVDGSNVTQPVSGTFWQATQPVSAASLPLPTGAAIAAKQPALGTAGTPSTDVITVQGAASMTKLLVTPDSVALPAHQSVNVDQLNGTTTDTNSGNKSAGTLRVVLATDQPTMANAQPVAQSGVWNITINTALPAGTNSIGTVQPGNTQNTTPWLVQDVPQTSGGLSRNYQVAPATPAKTAVKASAGQLYAIKASNNNSTPVYVKLFDAASASVILGTTNCDDQFEVPGNTAGAGFVYNVDKGVAFANAITLAVTGGIASNDNTSITASTVIVTAYYK